jgi:N-acetylmuramic acid 6-phosphate etherase
MSAKRVPCFLGVEGGGTRTVAVLIDNHEHVLQRIELGPANLRLLSENQLLARLQELARQMPVPAAVCIGLAGVRTEADRARVINASANVWPGVRCYPCADLETALAAAPAPAGPCAARVLVLSGTGSCCYGQAASGQTAKMGGWGHLLGDKGSGYDIALRALKAVVYYYDRDGAWSELGQSFLRALALNSPEDLIGWIHAAEKRGVASLALEVFAAWERHDEIASDILVAAAESLAKDAASCARRLLPDGGPVQFVLAGSVLLRQSGFARIVTARLTGIWPASRVVPLAAEGAFGAARLARELWATRAASRRARPPAKVKAGRNRLVSGVEAIPQVVIPESAELSPTERRNPRSEKLDRLSLEAAVDLMLSEEGHVPGALQKHRNEIVRCIRWVVQSLSRGGRLFYAGAGTSGRLGALDASECPPTFRAAPDQVQAIIAGGQAALWQSIEGAEDDAEAGAAAVRFRGVVEKDVLVGIAASGRTPFVWGALDQARRAGARTVLICFNPHLRIASATRPDLVIAPELGAEVLTGSTRLKAGTATKLLLNLITTLSMVRLGKVVSNLMVDLNPSNHKLRERAVRIVRELTGASEAAARQALEADDWVIKSALKQLSNNPIKPRRSRPMPR